MNDAAYYRSQAAHCRRLAKSASDARSAETLSGMAEDYERQARALEAGEAGPGEG